MTDTSPPGPTDDELARQIAIAYHLALWGGSHFTPNEHGLRAGHAALEAVRPHLQARGIAMAADRIGGRTSNDAYAHDWPDGPDIADELHDFARRHAEGGKNG